MKAAQQQQQPSEPFLDFLFGGVGSLEDAAGDLRTGPLAGEPGHQENENVLNTKQQPQVAFTSDKNGRTVAYRWLALAGRWVRISEDCGWLLVSTGDAREVAWSR